jgi:ferritin
MINDQIQRELEASNFYLALQYKFLTHNFNRPNFAKMLKSRAAEEREHAEMFMKFQVDRGCAVQIKTIKAPNVENINTMLGAIDAMIQAEVSLTKELVAMKKTAETSHGAYSGCDPLVCPETSEAPLLADMITSTFLKEQAEVSIVSKVYILDID